MSKLSILYDAWPLVHRPNSPAGMHLLAILAQLPDQVEPVLAFPEEIDINLSERVTTEVHQTKDNPGERRKWEQRTLPILARNLGVNGLHLTTSRAALLGDVPMVISPTGYGEEERRGPKLGSRIADALGKGGLARATALLWPSDLPSQDSSLQVFELPSMVHPDFKVKDFDEVAEIPDLDLPETYVLYHGPTSNVTLHRLLSGWTWAANTIGGSYPLLILGMDTEGKAYAEALAREYDIGDAIQVLPKVDPYVIPAIYQGSSAVFHPAPVSPWGGAARQAMACGRPIVTIDLALNEAMIGSAGYYIAADDTRKLGAEFITVVVKENLAETFIREANKRTNEWGSEDYGVKLFEVYQAL